MTPLQGQLVLWTSVNLGLSAVVSWLAMPTVNYVMPVVTWVLTATLLIARPSHYGGLATRSAMVLSLAWSRSTWRPTA